MSTERKSEERGLIKASKEKSLRAFRVVSALPLTLASKLPALCTAVRTQHPTSAAAALRLLHVADAVSDR